VTGLVGDKIIDYFLNSKEKCRKCFEMEKNSKHLQQLSSISLGKEQTFEAKVHFSPNIAWRFRNFDVFLHQNRWL